MKGIYRTIESAENLLQLVLDEQIPKPTFDDQSVLIRVKACQLTHLNSKPLLELLKKKACVRYPASVSIAGQVEQVGSAITTVQEGDIVTGLVPYNSEQTGCAEYCVLHEFDIVKLPDNLDLTDAVAGLSHGVRALTALHYQARLCSGDTVLIIDGATQHGTVMIQLALHWGAKVLTTVTNEDEKSFLEKNHPSLAQIILLEGKTSLLVSSVMDETGGLGADCIVDFGVTQFPGESNKMIARESQRLPLKHDIITCLAVGGRWVTSQADLQLDPPNSQIMYLKGASLSFLFEHIWTLSSSQQGRYQHILRDVVEKLSKKLIKPSVKIVPFDQAIDEMNKHTMYDRHSLVVRMSESYT